MHCDELMGIEKLWLRHQAEFLPFVNAGKYEAVHPQSLWVMPLGGLCRWNECNLQRGRKKASYFLNYSFTPEKNFRFVLCIHKSFRKTSLHTQELWGCTASHLPEYLNGKHMLRITHLLAVIENMKSSIQLNCFGQKISWTNNLAHAVLKWTYRNLTPQNSLNFRTIEYL